MTVSEACSYHLGRGIRKDDLLLPFSHWVASFVTPWTAAHQAPPPTEFPRQECWRGCHFLLQSIFPTQGSNPRLLCFLPWQADSLPLSQGLLGFLPWQADSLPLSCQGSSLEGIRLSKSEEDKCVISLVCGIKRKPKQQKWTSWIQRTYWWLPEAWVWGLGEMGERS